MSRFWDRLGSRFNFFENICYACQDFQAHPTVNLGSLGKLAVRVPVTGSLRSARMTPKIAVPGL